MKIGINYGCLVLVVLTSIIIEIAHNYCHVGVFYNIHVSRELFLVSKDIFPWNNV
jgi:hypothetical protein